MNSSHPFRVFCKQLFFTLAACAVAALAVVSAPAAPLEAPRADGILVAFKEQAPMAARASTVRRLSLAVDAKSGGRFFAKLRLGPTALSTDAALKQAMAELRKDPTVRVVQPNYIRHATAAPNDPSFARLWGLHNTGQAGGKTGADIGALQAWDKSTGSDSVVVAVVDTGVDYNHPDLKDNILRDGSGKVVGYDFVNNDADPMDDNEHGTHCAGTIGARGNNGVGVVGVCQRVKIMPMKFLDSTGSGSDSDAIQCIDWAREHGAKILSCSWGGAGSDTLMLEAIQRARDAGILLMAAAGNDGVSNDGGDFYPANYNSQSDNVISVAATDRNDQLADFSNFGVRSVDIAAPGVDILSTTPNNTYSVFSGTSMATPHVSGAAALVLSRFPGLSSSQLKARLLDSGDVLASLSGKTRTARRLDVNSALSAADDQVAPGAPADLAITHRSRTALRVAWTASGDDGAAGTASSYDLRASTAPITSANFARATAVTSAPQPARSGVAQSALITGLAAGQSYYVALRASDEAGNLSPLATAGPVSTLGSVDQVSLLEDTAEGTPQFTGAGSWAITTEESYSPSHSYADSPGASYANNQDVSLTQNASVLLANAVPTLSFRVKTDLEDTYDYLFVEVSSDDGGSWQQLLSLTGTAAWSLQQVSLARSFEQAVRVRFRLISDDSVTADGAWVDDIRIGGDRLVAVDDGGSPPAVPAAPSGLTARAVSAGEIDLSWTDGSSNETGFLVERKQGSGAFVQIGTAGANAPSFRDGAVSSANTYTYRVRATNGAGSSGYSNEAAATTPGAGPAAPTNLTARAISQTQATLAWQDRSSNESGFKIERKAGNGAYQTLRQAAANQTTFSDTGLTAGGSYTYRVRATNAAGDSDPSNESPVTTLPNPPPAPTRLAALAVSDTEIDLSWRGGSGDPTAFKIERKKENGSFKPLRALDPGVTTYNDTGLEANTLYTYRVRATNAGGDSDPSNEAAATTQAAVSGSLQAVRKVDFGQVRLHGVRTRSLTLRNTSRKNSMRVTVNTASSPFTVVSGSGSTLVAPGGSVALALRFSPTRRPRVTRTLVIETSDPANRRVSVSLTGTGR